MSDLFLILHKVRGEPAFDVAEKLTIGDEEGWIIPTSGHRAYPLDWWSMDDLVDCSGPDGDCPVDIINYDEKPKGFDALQDHYQVSAEPKQRVGALLERLGLKKKPVNLFIRGF